MGRRARGTVHKRKDRDGWWIRWRDASGRRRMAKGGDTKADAEAELAARLAQRDAVVEGRVTLAEYLVEYDDRLFERVGRATYRTQTKQLERVAILLDVVAMRDVSRAVAGDALRGLGCGPKTMRRYASALSKVWQDAQARGVVDANPWRRLDLPTREQYAVPYLSEHDLVRLYALLPARSRPAYVLLGETGMRVGELSSLTWQLVHDESVTVRGKGGRVRSIPLRPRAVAALTELRSRRVVPMAGPDLVLGDVSLRSGHARKKWREAVRALGFPRLRRHDLRHARASALVRAGVPIPTVARWLGHSTPALVLTTYGHHAPTDELRRALELSIAADPTSSRGPTEAPATDRRGRVGSQG